MEFQMVVHDSSRAHFLLIAGESARGRTVFSSESRACDSLEFRWEKRVREKAEKSVSFRSPLAARKEAHHYFRCSITETRWLS